MRSTPLQGYDNLVVSAWVQVAGEGGQRGQAGAVAAAARELRPVEIVGLYESQKETLEVRCCFRNTAMPNKALHGFYTACHSSLLLNHGIQPLANGMAHCGVLTLGSCLVALDVHHPRCLVCCKEATFTLV